MTAVVIPVRPGEDNPELVYTLRSIAAHVDQPDVWIVGHRPAWLHDVHWIPTHPVGEKSDRGCQQTRAAATHPDVPDRFWWWDDDMYRLTPLTDTRQYHGGPIGAWLDKFEQFEGPYARALRRTAALHVDADAVMWDIHVPFWVDDRHALADTMHDLPDGRGGWLWRTVHGNRLDLTGEQTADVKIYRDDPIPESPGPWLSSDDAAFHRMRLLLHTRFPNPSPWEGPADQPTALTATYLRGDATRTLPFRPDTDRTLAYYGWQRTALEPAGDDALV